MSDDPAGQAEGPHDILAAEAFAVPSQDPALHHGPVRLPDDPAGPLPHDVLAAEEFAFPAGRGGTAGLSGRAAGRGRVLPAVIAGLLLGLVVVRLARR